MRVAEERSAGAQLHVHGLRLRLFGDWPEVIEQVRRDFAWFAQDSAEAPSNGDGSRGTPPEIRIEVQRRPPDYGRFAGLEQTFLTPRNVVYSRGSRSVIDYFGIALSEYDREACTLLIQGEDADLVHEATYQFVLSRIGEHLDAIGLPRLHALGLAGRSGALALFLPSGGGKSTLALRALRDPEARLLSEDSPLIDRRGRLHPFPLRIGVNPHHAEELPPEHVRPLQRMEFHPKLVLDLDAYRDRIEPRPQPLAHIVIGRRSLGSDARLEPAARREAARTLLREVVVGVGLYQGMEFLLNRGLGDLGSQVRPGLVRAACCGAALRRARVWRLVIGRDRERNWAALRGLLE